MASAVLNRGEKNEMSVLVSGAGVGGLMAALECWRRGFNVRIVERAKGIVTTGDSFSIGYTAVQAFKNWPFLEEENEKIAYSPLVAYCKENGEIFSGPTDFKEIMSENIGNEKAKQRIYRHSRPKFHRMLYEQLGQIGLEVEFDKDVVDYFEDEDRGRAGVVLSGGTRLEADLVVAADGVRGKSWSLVAGQPVPARSSGDAMFRVAFPVEHVLSDPEILKRFPFDAKTGRSIIHLIFGEGYHAAFWRNEDEMSFGIQHKDHGTANEHWGHKVDADEVLRFTSTLPQWDPILDRVIKAAPKDSIVDYKLMWRDPQTKWTSPYGRVVQLGDAGHTFLPSSGNGGTQALEDAVSLATCLHIVGSKDKIPDATRVHNLLRFERVSYLQAFGVMNRQKQNTSKNGEDGKKKILHVGRWIVEHDPEEYASQNYKQALAHLQDPEVPFQNTNGPPGVTYKPWTIDGLLEAQRKGEPTVLDGDWS